MSSKTKLLGFFPLLTTENFISTRLSLFSAWCAGSPLSSHRVTTQTCFCSHLFTSFRAGGFRELIMVRVWQAPWSNLYSQGICTGARRTFSLCFQLIAVGHSMLWYSREATEKGIRGIRASCFLLYLGLSGDINSNELSFDWQCFPYSKHVKITYICLQGIFFGVNCGFQKPKETNTFPPLTS